MGLMFGADEDVTCIQNVELKGAEGEPLCLAYKTTKLFFGAGVYLKDDGYVLRPVSDAKKYYNLDQAQIAEYQAGQLLPKPLPPYSIPWYEFAFGYSLWIVIAVSVFFWRLGEARKRRRLEEDAATPTSYGPPVIETDADRFVQERAAALFGPGEHVQHQAYTLNHEPGTSINFKGLANYAVLTNQRLLLFESRVGAFGPLLESAKHEAIPRSQITRLTVDDRTIVVILDDGTVRLLFVPETKKLSNQRAFLRDVPRILGAAAVPASA